MFDNLTANKKNDGVNNDNYNSPNSAIPATPAPAVKAPLASPLAAAINNENKKPDKAALGRAVEDIFAETDSLSSSQFSPKEKPSIFKPKTEAALISGVNPGGDQAGRQIGKYIFLLIMFFGFVLVLIGAYIGYQLIFKDEPIEAELITEPIMESAADNTPTALPEEKTEMPASDNIIPAGETSDPNVSAPETVPQTEGDQDTDQDGLTDAEEESLGMSINSADSDSDGLYDREEVKVYKTDPLNPDTDGDTFLDGEEVKNGFNPKGAGKLYDIN